MSKMAIVNADGVFERVNGTMKIAESEHPVYKARVAIALDLGGWLYAPDKGHTLGLYKRVKASPDKIEEFQKTAKLYLSPYGPEVTSRLIRRGQLGFSMNITKETING